MKNRKAYLLRGLLVLLAAALVLAAALPGLGLSTGGPTPLPQAQADPLRPEGQSQSPQTPPDQPEEPDTPQEPDTPEDPQEPEQPQAQTLDLAALVEQLQKSPELASTLAALLTAQKAG